MPSPGVSLPGPFETVPSPVLLLEPPWLHTSAGAEFEQRVLNECGLAQVGFGVDSTSFLCLTVSSRSMLRGRLNPEPLRLTRPVGGVRE